MQLHKSHQAIYQRLWQTICPIVAIFFCLLGLKNQFSLETWQANSASSPDRSSDRSVLLARKQQLERKNQLQKLIVFTLINSQRGSAISI
jgi:hypothetical protein